MPILLEIIPPYCDIAEDHSAMEQNTMPDKPEASQKNTRKPRALDKLDRKILAALVEDAEQGYATLAKIVGLSAPAVHERVKRLKASGHIQKIAAILNGPSVDKPFLAFIHADTQGWGSKPELVALSAMPEVEEIHSVAGDTCMLLKVRVASSDALEGFLARLYDVPSVTGSRSYVVLSTYLERTVQAGVTEELAIREYQPHEWLKP